MPTDTDESPAADQMKAVVPPLRVWEISGEDLVVATSEHDMRAVFRDYVGESIRGYRHRELVRDAVVKMTHDGGATSEEWTASEVAATLGRGYHRAFD